MERAHTKIFIPRYSDHLIQIAGIICFKHNLFITTRHFYFMEQNVDIYSDLLLMY